MQNSIGSCSICLEDIDPTDESFVEPCFHHYCFQCIVNWTREQQSKGLPPTCPVCQCLYTRVIHDCHDGTSYRIWNIDGSVQPGIGGGGFVLTPAHRRRRSVYNSNMKHLDHELPSSLRTSMVTTSLLARPASISWLRRELQAILLQDDVELVLQHIIGTLKSHLASSQTSRRPKSGLQPPSKALDQDVAQELMAEAAAPYLPEFCARFSAEYVNFLTSGLNVDAHDAVAFHIDAVQGEEDDEYEREQQDRQSTFSSREDSQ